MKTKIYHYLLFAVFLLLHLVWLYTISEQITPELVFPVWLIKNSRIFVSEIYTMYPLGLFNLVSSIYSLTGNLRSSIYIVTFVLVSVLDLILVFYLSRRFKFKFAALGLIFYILWQVFARGNYLWFDLATIPFIALSFIFFEKYVKSKDKKYLLKASVILALGNFFKNTTAWIFIFYLIWIIITSVREKQFLKKILSKSVILLMPPLTIVLINLLFFITKSSFSFSFYWSIIMGYLIFPRLENFSRFMDLSYLPIFAILMSFYFISSFIILKISKKTFLEKWFLISFPIAALASIFPRWSDFRLGPFIFFLSIIFTYALSLSKLLAQRVKLYFVGSLVILFAFMSVGIANRISSEIKSSKSPGVDFVDMFIKSGLTDDIEGRSTFAYENPFFSFNLENANSKYDLISLSKLIITDPDLYYYIRGPQAAFEYLRDNNPDYLFLLPETQKRLTKESNLTDVEKLILKDYRQKSKIDPLYFVYKRKD